MLSFILHFYTRTSHITIAKEYYVCLNIYFCPGKNRLEQKGLQKRFTINCYGKQKHEDSRAEKNKMYKILSDKKIALNIKNIFLNTIQPTIYLENKSKEKKKRYKEKAISKKIC